MEKYTVIYSPEAMDDLRSIYSYIAFKLKEPGIAKKLVDKIRNDIRKLYEQPERYAPVEWEPWKSMGMRKLPIGNYVVLYLTDNGQKEVSITRIFYGGRNIEKIISEQ